MAGDNWKTILQYLKKLTDEARKLGLMIRPTKCELPVKAENTVSIREKLNVICPLIELIPVENVTIKGAALGEKSIDAILEKKNEEFKRISTNIKDFPKHQAFFLIKNCFAIPKLLYIFHTSAVLKKDKISQELPDNLKDTIESVTDISLGRDTWTQLTLPVKLGGFGLRFSIELAPSAFIAMFVSCSLLATSLLNNHSQPDSLLREALSIWKSMAGETSSITSAMTKPLRKQWTNPVSKNNLGLLIEQSATDLQKARLQGDN